MTTIDVATIDVATVLADGGGVLFANVFSADDLTRILARIAELEFSKGGGHRQMNQAFGEILFTRTGIVPNPGQKTNTWFIEFCNKLSLCLALRGHEMLLDAILLSEPLNVIINKYFDNVGIGPHIDHPGFSWIIIVSLGRECNMTFTKPSGEKIDVILPIGSILVLPEDSDARNFWKHEIDNTSGQANERTSLTIRGCRK
jgi:hypothetical protein